MAASPDPGTILARYDLGAVSGMTAAGGTAGRTWRVATATGDYFLRLRGARTSSDARLRYDHGLRDHLVRHGIGTASPLPATDGVRWHRVPDGVYELYRLVVGRLFDPERDADVAAAGAGLARYHLAAARYRPPSEEAEPIAQFTRLGFSDATSDRMDDPQLQLATLRAVEALTSTTAERQLLEACMSRVGQLCDAYAGDAYERLTGWVIHGDYTPANLLFDTGLGDGVAIFDLDWALPGARCRDVADGLYFFGCRPRTVDGADIWSLTDAGQLDLERCRRFLSAYAGVAPLEPHEVEALPHAFAGRWLSIRLEGMAKVDAADRFRFFARDIEIPLAWWDRHGAELRP